VYAATVRGPAVARDASRICKIPTDGCSATTPPVYGQNVPFQTDALAGYTPSPDGLFEPNGSTPILADDAAAAASAAPLDGAALLPELDVLDEDAPGSRAYLGQTGLGALYVQDSVVRPFRRVISAQAVSRREVVLP